VTGTAPSPWRCIDGDLLEAELNTRLEPEVALVVVAMRKVIAKTGQ
jgi:hypothetical protein